MELFTDRLILRAWQEGDVADLIDGLNDLEVAKWLIFVPHPYTTETALTWINQCQQQSSSETNYEWAVVLREENKVIGGTSLIGINQLQGTAAGGGIWINKKYRGHGYGAEAFNRRIEFAFETLGLRRLNNGFLVGNKCSQKLQENLGYKIEGLKRQAYISAADGEIKDEVITGLLKEEWQAPH